LTVFYSVLKKQLRNKKLTLIHGDSSPHRVKFGFLQPKHSRRTISISFEQTKITVHTYSPTVHLRQFISDNLSSVIHFETIKLQTNDTRAIHIQIIHLRKFISDNSTSTLHLQNLTPSSKKQSQIICAVIVCSFVIYFCFSSIGI
jgi:hypothetical protein